MEFIFWQGALSIHQSSFIKALSYMHKVVLVVKSQLNEARMAQGWGVPNMGNAKIIVDPNDNEVNKLLQSKSTFHIFSGFHPFQQATNAMEYLHKDGRKFSLFIEPFEWTGVKGVVRYIKYISYRIKYDSNIHRMFVTGIKAQKEYEFCGFRKNKIRQWGYFTSELKYDIFSSRKDDVFKVIFIGTLNKNKNIESLIKAILRLSQVSLDIVGSGPLSKVLNERYDKFSSIIFHGNIPNKFIPRIISESDLLVLPSLYDGWGAVVNEALTVGTPVLVSKNCGASILVGTNGERGTSFKLKNLFKVLKHQVDKGKPSNTRRNKIRLWAHDNLSGNVVARYFCESMMENSSEAPWVKNS